VGKGSELEHKSSNISETDAAKNYPTHKM